eukprot:gene41386-51247_t
MPTNNGKYYSRAVNQVGDIMYAAGLQLIIARDGDSTSTQCSSGTATQTFSLFLTIANGQYIIGVMTFTASVRSLSGTTMESTGANMTVSHYGADFEYLADSSSDNGDDAATTTIIIVWSVVDGFAVVDLIAFLSFYMGFVKIAFCGYGHKQHKNWNMKFY